MRRLLGILVGLFVSPGNGSVSGDSEVNLTSHEEFETISDPDTQTGWYDAAGYENGDKCAWDFASGNGTTTLNNSGVFEMQMEYSNASRSCVNTYSRTPTPPTPGPTPTISSYSPSSGAVGTRSAPAISRAPMD